MEAGKYHYDALGNLLSVDLPDGRLVEYVIDGQNRRIGKKIDGVLTKAWLYKDLLKPIAELDGSGNLTARFVYGSKTNTPDVILKYNGGLVTTYRVISDHLGSPIMAVNVNNSSDVPFAAEYSAFGERTVSSGAASESWMPFGFTGGLYDADTKLTRLGAWDYDAQVGRWVSKDPILFDGGQTDLFVYVGNDPVNYLDPDGTVVVPVVAAIAGGFVAGVLTGSYLWGWQGLMPGAGPDWHHNRNMEQTGKCPPKDPTANICSADWNRFSSFAPLHGGGVDVRGLGAFGGVQCIYQSDGSLETARGLEGTFDYTPPDDPWGHVKNDMWPWILYGP